MNDIGFETFIDDERKVIYEALSRMNININFDRKDDLIVPCNILSKIKCVEISCCVLRNLEFLKKLPNLEELKIVNKYDYSRVTIGLYSTDFYNLIAEFTGLSDLTSLKKLTIINDLRIDQIDFTNLENLTEITLINNPNLRNITGIGNLHKLKKIQMYGNHIVKFDSLYDYMLNTIDSEVNYIDLGAFFSYATNIEKAKELYTLSLTGLSNVVFSEKNGQVDYYTTNISNIYNLYENLVTIFKREKVYQKNKEQKIDYIYNYIIRNIKFSTEELEQRAKLYNDLNKNIPEYYKNHFGYTHNSFNTYELKKGNCEGMVNLMKFMASMLGIDSEDVHCSDRRTPIGALNHAIFRTEYNGAVSYFDPAFRICNKDGKSYSNMSFKQVSDYLELSMFERNISYKSYRDKLRNLDVNLKEYKDFNDWICLNHKDSLDINEIDYDEILNDIDLDDNENDIKRSRGI